MVGAAKKRLETQGEKDMANVPRSDMMRLFGVALPRPGMP